MALADFPSPTDQATFVSGRWFRIGKVRSYSSFFAQKTFTFLWSFFFPSKFLQKKIEANVLPPKFFLTTKSLEPIFSSLEILEGKPRMPGLKPPTVKADHNRGTQGNYFDPWPLQQFLSRISKTTGWINGWPDVWMNYKWKYKIYIYVNFA